MIRHLLAVLLLIFPALLAQAQTKYFRCTDQWGHAIFSERPCGADAQEGSVQGPSVREQPKPSSGISSTTSPPLGIETFSHEITRAKRRLTEIETLLGRSVKKIAKYERERDQEVLRLNSQSRYVSNAGAAVAWQNDFVEEVRTVKEQYNAKIQYEQEEVKDLKRERKDLKKALAKS
ncbi:MAG: hypothetical protein ACJAYC_000139 [Halieaceae bacterium]|jgi:hypothetical protein